MDTADARAPGDAEQTAASQAADAPNRAEPAKGANSLEHSKAAEALRGQAAGPGSTVRPPDLDASSGGRVPLGDSNLHMILDIPVTIAMEIGRVRVPIRNLLQLTQGSVVELDRLAGEALDVTVNGTLIAHGEVVVVNERYGIRFTDVISPAERVQKLR
jgi:flagellar motor switch protein FliN/FliY